MAAVLSVLATTLLAATAVSAGKANTWELVGETGASAQQMFLGVSPRARLRFCRCGECEAGGWSELSISDGRADQ